ncbi:MAG: molybdate ABC transporter substrate-binding protein [Alphaproteobacteria bacterium]
MRRRILLATLAAAVIVTAPAGAKTRGVLIFAAASTAEAVNAVNVLYAETHGARARAVFAASSTLARQIDNGAPANVFLSANRKWMDWLEARGDIVADSRRDLFGNRLVLVAPSDSNLRINIERNFPLARLLGAGRLALADPNHVPAGIYAKQALSALGIWQAVGGRAARTRDVRGALALVERGEAAAGIVYATDAGISKRVRIIASFPRATHAPIVYNAALVRGRDHGAARKFFAFLTSPPARATFARHGFTID